MLIGNGLIARGFASRYASDPRVTVFASGVSNSRECDTRQFEREYRLLVDALAGEAESFVYFSSCGVLSGETTPYMRHKRRMEELVRKRAGGMVFRLPQVVGLTSNPTTLTNFLYARISRGEAFTVWKSARRSLIDVDDLVAICSSLIDEPPDANIVPVASGRSLHMLDLVSIFERVLGKRACYTVVEGGHDIVASGAICAARARRLGIRFDEGYEERLLRKYYPRPS